MEILLSWIVAALAAVCLVLLGSRSYHKHLRELAEEATERCEEQRKKVSRRAGELALQVAQQQREIAGLKTGQDVNTEVSET